MKIINEHIGYIYKTTNLINNKIYIGQKYGAPEKTEKYFGSGKHLNSSINKYGKENFKKEILSIYKFSDKRILKKILDKTEIFNISYFKSMNPKIGYNMTKGGRSGVIGIYVTEETRKKLSNSLLGHKVSEGTTRKIIKTRNREKEANLITLYACPHPLMAIQ